MLHEVCLRIDVQPFAVLRSLVLISEAEFVCVGCLQIRIAFADKERKTVLRHIEELTQFGQARPEVLGYTEICMADTHTRGEIYILLAHVVYESVALIGHVATEDMERQCCTEII